MTEPAETPVWKTNVLWAVLSVFLVIGTVGGATFVYGLTWVLSGALFGWVIAAVGALVAILAFLFMAGILYRVDRYRGATERRLELFE